ncbi:DUF2264 domain-containing protein [Streptomyces albofaciens]|uniref:DUF2264 domain-containing protein n=1 Tax=Streptomyces albofaciens TaxID=66866 RepID=UPI001FCAD808|nr:DUF2264 domain-containing protein [Streptomyces albofaciens]
MTVPSLPHPTGRKAVSLPPEDRERSPYTGWTRAHWETTADTLLEAVAPYASPRNGLINLPGVRPSWSGPRSDGLEGYARTFLAAAFRVAGSRGEDPHGLLARYAEGLAAGTEHPVDEQGLGDAHPDAWPLIPGTRQAIVESASIALGLRLTRPWLWDTLDEGVRARAVDWLLPALDPPPIDNNWWLFGLTVGGFLLDAGIETERAQASVDRALERVEGWYRGEGWYSDGPNRSFDHYNGWALHFYPVLHAHLSGDRALLDTYGERLHAHLDGYRRMFDANGAPMPFGRSLTYRFATLAAPWLGALTGHTPLSPGATRRLTSGALRHFLDRGAVTAEGLLPLGWYGPYAPMLQGYSGPASPYWASKGLAGLLLPAGHPVWAETEEPLPAETADAVTTLRAPGLLVQSTVADGLVRLHNHGSASVFGPADPNYARFAYSTRTGPSAAEDAPAVMDTSANPGSDTTLNPTPDNHFALLVDGVPTGRGTVRALGGGPGWAASAHVPCTADGSDVPGVRVRSATLAHGRAEVRAHLVTGAAPGTPVRQTGWAVTDDGPTAQLHPVHGFDADARTVRTGSTPFGEHTRTACLDGTVPDAPDGALFVSLASLTAEAAPGPVHKLAEVRVSDGHTLHVTWEDGSVSTLSLDQLDQLDSLDSPESSGG